MSYIFKILCLLFWPKKLDRDTIKSIYTMDVLLFVATMEAIVGSYIIKTTLMWGVKNILPALIVLIFAFSYFLSYGSALILFISNLIAIKRLTYRECLKAVMPTRMTSAFYMIIYAVLSFYGLEIFYMITNAIMWLHQISLIVYYLRKLYFCSRKDLAVLVVLYVAILSLFFIQMGMIY